MGTSDPGLCSNSKHEDADTCHHSRLFLSRYYLHCGAPLSGRISTMDFVSGFVFLFRSGFI